jgi:hypothetical protein
MLDLRKVENTSDKDHHEATQLGNDMSESNRDYRAGES